MKRIAIVGGTVTTVALLFASGVSEILVLRDTLPKETSRISPDNFGIIERNAEQALLLESSLEEMIAPPEYVLYTGNPADIIEVLTPRKPVDHCPRDGLRWRPEGHRLKPSELS